MTILVTLGSDLLIGILAGIVTKLIIHSIYGVPFKSLFKPFLTINEEGDVYTVDVEHSAIFSNYIGLKKQLDNLPRGKKIILDFADTRVVDHTVMEHLHELAEKYRQGGGQFVIQGLDDHKPISGHPLATRKNMSIH